MLLCNLVGCQSETGRPYTASSGLGTGLVNLPACCTAMIQCDPKRSIGRFKPAEEAGSRQAPHQCEIVFFKYFIRMPAAGGPVSDRTLESIEVDDTVYQ